ncbi:hypothetical protein HBA55_36230 [Pseudomaricurvus alkylphenolicus]|uniref:hypothetical protein n=1 Tax=Pseudomaricurvus alkylphenolicus TaxID=1306991 RepID=UPI00141DC3D2|nr:hypothetical protein [Pseudomaricurvus alkylphenolicus]NIB45083.1 hypothetical protein [Pseudomaricurvus alkylphenolicus]
METILDTTDYARILIGVLPDKASEIEAELVRLRDGYEHIFIALCDQLPVKKTVDKRLLRLMSATLGCCEMIAAQASKRYFSMPPCPSPTL